MDETLNDISALQVAEWALFLINQQTPGRLTDIGGLSPAQRLLIAYGQIYADNAGPEEIEEDLKSSEYVPNRLRPAIACENSRMYYRAFGVEAGDRGYRPEPSRVRIWAQAPSLEIENRLDLRREGLAQRPIETVAHSRLRRAVGRIPGIDKVVAAIERRRTRGPSQ